MADVRQLALRLLEGWERDETYLALALNSPMTADLAGGERAFLTSLLYGTVERKITLDYMISVTAARSELDGTTRNILRLGMYQLFYMDRIPGFAAVSKTVDLARTKGERGFINGVLRGALRSFVDDRGEKHIPLPPREKNLARHLSVLYSLPIVYVRHFLALLGDEQGERLLASLQTPAPLTLAVNTTKISRQDYAKMLDGAGIRHSLTVYSPIGIKIEGSLPVHCLPGFAEGLAYVQDEASQMTAEVLSPMPGNLLIDTCSCPGGKSFAAAIKMQGEGKIQAFDLHESKLPLVEEGANRLSLDLISVSCRDACEPAPELLGRADAVICDVPCSGLGVLRKKPDLRYSDPTRMAALPPLQAEILEASVKYLKPGGRLLYSTCTVNPAENEGVFEAFLQNNPVFEAVPFSIGDLDAPKGELTLYPHIHDTDGFFMALLRRKSV